MRTTLVLTVLVCIASLFLQQVCCRPYENQLTDKNRQDIMHYAAKIIKLAYGGEEWLPGQEKRNSGMLDAVINMPDLFKAGRK